LFEGILGGGDDITQEHNHIYFKTDVTMESIKKLMNIIDNNNREYERQIVNDTLNFVFPKPLYLHITSNGGDLFGGFLAYDAIRNSKMPIYTVVDGYAVSSGSIMFMAGKKRFMNPNSYILIHQLSKTVYGTQKHAEAQDEVDNNNELMTRLYQLYLTEFRHGYAPVPEENVLQKPTLERHMAHDIYWNYQTCFKYGLTDGIYANYQEREEIDRREFYQLITNSKVKLPTYAEATGSFEREQYTIFGSRTAFEPGLEIQNRIHELIKNDIESRKRDEDLSKGSTLLRQFQNTFGDNNEHMLGDDGNGNVDLISDNGSDISDRSNISTRSDNSTRSDISTHSDISTRSDNSNEIKIISTRSANAKRKRAKKYEGSDYIPSENDSDSA
jgi:ATP-dependent protease ClpP protease subunit